MNAESIYEDGSVGQVSEIIGLLNAVAPGKLNGLRKDYPEYAATLEPGAILGRGDNKRILFLLAVAQEGVEAAEFIAEKCCVEAQKRLTTALRLEFAAKAASLLGSMGTIILVLYLGKDVRTVFVAACSFIGSLSVAGAGLYRTGIGGGTRDLPAVHAKLATSIAELGFLRARLASYSRNTLLDEISQKDALRLVDRAEQLCRNVRAWASEVPGGCIQRVEGRSQI
jgi:hypothetical protein